MTIKLLDPELINKIAAGEVVIRPASVVKELLENSIDAGALKIFIHVREGGKSFIKVTDDGSGMDEDDVRLSVQKHATSKIDTVKDLFNVCTLGFRGEALSSIAAVSRMQIFSRSQAIGTRLVIEGGKITKEERAVIPRGTKVIVKDLFFNVPVRKKHLKSIDTELRHIIDIVTSYALLYPEKYFELVHNKKVNINSPVSSGFVDNIATIFGSDIAKNMIPVSYNGNLVNITGCISNPGYQRNNRGVQALFVNSRAVRCRELDEPIYDAYKALLNINKHPLYVLNFEIENQLIDVNVHPQKTAIRLDKSERIASEVSGALRKRLLSTVQQKPIVVKTSEADASLKDYNIIAESQQYLAKKEKKHDFRILGQILKTYVIVAMGEGMLVIDQHAGQERVMYEKFMKQFMDNSVTQQELIEPVMIELTPVEKLTFEEHIDMFNRLGYETKWFGRNTLLLRAVPDIFGRLQGRDVFLAILDELKTGKSRKLDAVREERIIRKACRSSIKAGDPLETAELISLVDELFSAAEPYTCPHGRPTMIRFTSDDLEKMFRRKGL